MAGTTNRMNVGDKFDVKLIENQIRAYYQKPEIKNIIRTFLDDGNNFSKTIGYVDGPPTMNGDPHIGHLRGRIIKDLWYRKNSIEKKRDAYPSDRESFVWRRTSFWDWPV